MMLVGSPQSYGFAAGARRRSTVARLLRSAAGTGSHQGIGGGRGRCDGRRTLRLSDSGASRSIRGSIGRGVCDPA